MPEEILETPQPTPPTESKSTDWTKIILAAVLGFGLLAGSAYAGYWYGTQQVQPVEEPTPVVSQPTPTPEPTTPPVTDPTTGWVKYTNSEYNFEMRYPTSWEVLSEGWGAGTSEGDAKSKYQVALGENSTLLSILIIKSDQYQTFESLSKVPNLPSGPATVISSSEVVVGGIRALYIIQDNDSEGVVMLDTAKNMVVLEIIGSGNRETFNQILSTFKFLD